MLTIKHRRGKRSTIEQLDKAIVAKINKLIEDGHTVTEITDKLGELGEDVSRSAVGRYAKNVRESMAQLMNARVMSEGWAKEIKEAPEGDIGRLVNELLQMVALQAASQMANSEKATPANQIMFLSAAMKNLSAATKTDIGVALLREKIKQQTHEVAEQVVNQMREDGASEASIVKVRTDILGIGGET